MIPLLLFLVAGVTIGISVVETAFTVLLRLSLRLLAERDDSSDLVGAYLDEPVRLILPVRLLLGFALVVATLLVIIQVGGTTVSGRGTIALTMLTWVIVCQYVVPWIIVRRFGAAAIIASMLPTLVLLLRPFRPMTQLFAALVSSRPVARPAANEHDAGGADEPHPESPTEETVTPAEAEREERRLLRSIVDFGDTLVREVMTPRPDVVAISIEATIGQLKSRFREQEYSRIPVFKESLDNIVGIVYVKDLILGSAEDENRPIASIMRAPYVVPETKRVADLLREFQQRQVQSAIVLDEYGGTAGLVTLEDLLEEIVGEIRDEYDVETDAIVDAGDGTFVVSGKVDIDEVSRRLGVRIEREGFETVGGFLLSNLGRVPTVGETIDLDGLHVEVLEAERRRITKVRIRRQPVGEPTA